MVKKINTEEFDSMNKDGLAVVDFNASWCGPCKMLAPLLEEVSKEYEGRVAFYSVDVDENEDLAERFNIMSVPALVVLKDGAVADTSVGFVPKKNLCAFIDKNL